jgi:hypothetical protein
MAKNSKLLKWTLGTLAAITAAATMVGCAPKRTIPAHGHDDAYHSTSDICSRRSGEALRIARDLYHDPTISEFDIPKSGDSVYDTAENYLCNLIWYTDPTGHATEAHYFVREANSAPVGALDIDAMEYARGENGFVSPTQAPIEQSPLEQTVIQATQAPASAQNSISKCWYKIQPGDTLSDLFFNSDYADGLKAAYGDYRTFEREVVFDNYLQNPDSIKAGQVLSFAYAGQCHK